MPTEHPTPTRNPRLTTLSITLLLAALPCLAAADDAFTLDHLIERVDRLEFYRLSDFGPPESRCHPCQTAQHAKCDPTCYSEIPNLSLICTQKIRGLSIGPFDREARERVLGELFKTDMIFITTAAGVDTLEAPRIASVAGHGEEDFAIDIEDLDNSFKNVLVRASTATAPEQFSVKVGTADYTIPLSARMKDGFYRFLKQCPD